MANEKLMLSLLVKILVRLIGDKGWVDDEWALVEQAKIEIGKLETIPDIQTPPPVGKGIHSSEAKG